MTPGESVKFSNISASTSAFVLKGGKYAVTLVGANFGTVKLQILAADLATYISVSTATDFSANGFGVADCPPGQYRLTVATADAIYAAVTRIPL